MWIGGMAELMGADFDDESLPVFEREVKKATRTAGGKGLGNGLTHRDQGRRCGRLRRFRGRRSAFLQGHAETVVVSGAEHEIVQTQAVAAVRRTVKMQHAGTHSRQLPALQIANGAEDFGACVIPETVEFGGDVAALLRVKGEPQGGG